MHTLRAIAVLFLVALAPPTAAAADLIIEHVTVIDGTGGQPLPDRTVIVRGDRIHRVMTAEEYAADPPPKTVVAPTVIDGRNRFLIPGLWDLHVHPDDPELWHLDPPPVEKERFLELFVAAGVTSVRDMGGNLELLQDWRRRIEAGELLGPHIVCCGPLVDGPEPMWPGSVAVGTAEEGRAAVDDLIERGADFIKVYSLLPRDGFLAIAERCRQREIPFAGHVPHSVTVGEATASGITSMEHLLGMVRATANPARLEQLREAIPEGLQGVARRNAEIAAMCEAADPDLTADLAEEMALRGVAHVPTMILWKRRAWFDAKDPRVASWLPLMPTTVRNWWDPARNIHLQELSNESMAGERMLYARYLELVGALHEAGVEVLPGTDTGGNPHLFPGASIHDELEILVEAGLTPAQAIRAATSASAALCRDSERGTIAEGQIADLVLLLGDPLADIRHTRMITSVIVGGLLLDSAAITRVLRPYELIPR